MNKQKYDKIEINPTDVIILRGEWEPKDVDDLIDNLSIRGNDNIILGLPLNGDISCLSLKDFYSLMRKVEEKITKTGV